MNKIKEFQGEYRWLSNFAPVKIKLHGYTFASVEAAYMSAKCSDTSWKLFCADSLRNTAGKIKKESRNIELVDNWEAVKVGVMRKCLVQKYTQQPYHDLLLATGDTVIEEGNMWNDKFWGICLKTGKGENNLGMMIMSIRKELGA